MDHNIPIRMVRWTLGSLEISLSEIAAAANISLTDRASVSYDESIRLWEAAEQITGDDAVGHRAGTQQRIDGLGPAGMLFASAETVRQGIEVLALATKHLLPDSEIWLEPEGGSATLCYIRPKSDIRTRHGVEALAAVVVSLARHCARAPVPVEHVSFDNPRPRDPALQEGFYGSPVSWDSPHLALGFGARFLDLPIAGADPKLHSFLNKGLRELLLEAPEPAAVGRIRRAILADAQGKGAGIASVARSLGTSPRTLQRQLKQLNLEFRVLRRETLMQRAHEMLKQSDSSIATIADVLGYATVQSFERAFRATHAQTPTEARDDNN